MNDPAKKTLLILLLGGRILPVITTALHFRPEMIGLICSDTEPQQIENARKTLARLLPETQFLASACVPPYAVQATRAEVETMIGAAVGLTPVLSVTSAPVPMTIGAYEAGREVGPVYYRPAGSRQLLDLTERHTAQPVVLTIRVDEYIQIYGLSPDLNHKPSLQDTPGSRLEKQVFKVAQHLQYRNQPLFDECWSSYALLVGGAKREIDFIGITADMPLVASCKTGESSWQKKDLDELRMWGELLGGKNCVTLYVSDQPAPDPTHRLKQRYEQFQKNAAKARIVVVTGDDLKSLETILSREQLTPTYPRQ